MINLIIFFLLYNIYQEIFSIELSSFDHSIIVQMLIFYFRRIYTIHSNHQIQWIYYIFLSYFYLEICLLILLIYYRKLITCLLDFKCYLIKFMKILLATLYNNDDFFLWEEFILILMEIILNQNVANSHQ